MKNNYIAYVVLVTIIWLWRWWGDLMNKYIPMWDFGPIWAIPACMIMAALVGLYLWVTPKITSSVTLTIIISILGSVILVAIHAFIAKSMNAPLYWIYYMGPAIVFLMVYILIYIRRGRIEK